MRPHSEWATNQHRDTCASHLGHYDTLSYFAVAQVLARAQCCLHTFLKPPSNLPPADAMPHSRYQTNPHATVAQNDSIGRVRYQLLEKMLQPCGPPPEKEADE